MAAEKFTELECHRKFAVDLFNLVWSLLNKKDKTKEEDDKMIHAAHASRFHWGEIGKPVNLGRGEWQISRVYSILNKPESALYHAKRYLEICKENSIGGFDLAYAYEAMARAHGVSGSTEKARHFFVLAEKAGEAIAKPGDKKQYFSDIAGLQKMING